MGLPEDEVMARVDSALEAVRMSSYRDRLSHHLSVGEKKRIAIATVLSMNPKILILDEPSAGLDPRARRTLINLLRDLPITMLVSTHDIRMVQELFPRTIVMDDGRIVEQGTHATLNAKGGLYARLAALQFINRPAQCGFAPRRWFLLLESLSDGICFRGGFIRHSLGFSVV